MHAPVLLMSKSPLAMTYRVEQASLLYIYIQGEKRIKTGQQKLIYVILTNRNVTGLKGQLSTYKDCTYKANKNDYLVLYSSSL